MQIRIPVLPREEQLTIPEDHNFEITHCTLVEVDGEVSKNFIAANEMQIPGIYQRTIYFKGRNESLRIGMLLVDLEQRLYSLKVDDPMSRPAGLDIQLTLKLTTKEQP
uniref:Uncharacterized protein n=1 Tax=Pseudomonas phage RVTF4 TaxID=3236931 RepID=A0AB39CD90_9VIRU